MIGYILSSKFVDDSLQAIFGKLLPVELPLTNQRLLDMQIEFLKRYCEQIVLTVPEGYELILPKHIKKMEVKNGLELLEVFELIFQDSINHSSLFVLYGDSLFLEDSLESGNFIYMGKPNLDFNWGFGSGELVPAGAFSLDREIFKNALNNTKCLDDFFKNLYSLNVYQKNNHFWLDFGHSITYFSSKAQFLESRAFNSISVSNGFVRKQSKDFLKMWSEYSWLFDVKTKLPNNIPYTKNFSMNVKYASYEIEYLFLPSLAELFVFGKLSDVYIRKILLVLKDFLLQLHSIPLSPNNHFPKVNFLYTKLLSRKDRILELVVEYNLNFMFYSNLIDENLEYFFEQNLSPFCLIHGDFCFSNILFDMVKFKPICIDPRGYFFEDLGFSLYGPSQYDYYKLAHSYVVGYDYIVAEKYDEGFFSVDNIRERMRIFTEMFEIDSYDLKMGLKNLFLSLIPLHYEDRKRQKSFFELLVLIDSL